MNKPFLLLAAVLALALVGANPAHALTEAAFEPAYHQVVLPFFNAGKEGYFAGQAGVHIHYVSFVNPAAKGAVVISNGYTENTTEYAENIFDLSAAGYSVFVIDHRGQGLSGRMLADKHLAYIDDFQFFVDDLKTFVDTVVKLEAPGFPLYLWGHSLGGAIAARYAELYGEDFKAMALTAPMLAIQLPNGWNPITAKAALRTLHLLGQGENIVFGQKHADPRGIPFSANTITHSEARYGAYVEASGIKNQSILYAPTNDWVMRALDGAETTLNGAKNAATPMLILQADTDTFVENPAESSFCSVAPRCELQAYSGSNHEIMMETDSIRSTALSRMLDFFAGHP